MRRQWNSWPVTALSVVALIPTGSALGSLGVERASTIDGARHEPARAAAVTANAYGSLAPGAFAAYATGTVVHSDPGLSLDEDGDATGLEFDLAVSDAAHASAPVPPVHDELGREAIPAIAAGQSFGRGRGIQLPERFEEFDLGDFDTTPAEAKAPPTTGPVEKESSSPIDLSFVKADSFKSSAMARAVPTGCVIGDDLARGIGRATNTKVDGDPEFDDEDDAILSLEIDDPPPPRAVSQSTSWAALTPIPSAPGRWGLVAETRQTIAPVTFGIPGVDDLRFTLEIGGEYVLRGTADGGKGMIDFGPENADDARPVARLFRNGDQIADLGFGDRFPLIIGDEQVGEVVIGEDPHAIGNDAEPPLRTGLRVAAALDLAVVRINTGDQMRVGHMEIDVTIPPNGVTCPGIAVQKTSQPTSVTAGSPVTYTIRVSNPNDCVLDKVVVIDSPSVPKGVQWKVATTLPPAVITRDGSLKFENFGPVKLGETKVLTINGEIESGSAPGTISNAVTATGDCARSAVAGSSSADTIVRPGGGVAVPPPVVQSGSDQPATRAPAVAPAAAPAVPPTPVALATAAAPATETNRGGGGVGALARTGAGLTGLFVGPALLFGGLALRRRRVRD